MIFHPCLGNSVQTGEFCPWRTSSSLETLFQCRAFYSAKRVCRLLSSTETFIQGGDFYPLRRLLSSSGTFIQFGNFYPVWNFYPVGRLLSSIETFFQFSGFFPNQTAKKKLILQLQFQDFNNSKQNIQIVILTRLLQKNIKCFYSHFYFLTHLCFLSF